MDKVTRQCPQTTTFEEKGEPKPYRTEVLSLTSLMVGSHGLRNLQLSKSCISLQLFEITNGQQKDELNQA